MRLKTFIGRTMSEAMAMAREHLGPDAIIVSTQEDGDGVMRVTAAIDQRDPFPIAPAAAIDALDLMGDALTGHGLSPALVEKILAAALPYEADEPATALSGALDALYGFAPVTVDEHRRVLLLAGPPGAGKTVSIAKLAARAVMAGEQVRLITADATRAGGIEQLEAFARILKLRLQTADSAHRLGALAASAAPGELMLIDTAGINPYNAGDRRELATLIAASEAEPILVLPAGGDTVDTVEIARIFRDLGCSRLIVTRLDLARRLGSVVAVADELRLSFAEAGVAPAIADGLTPFNPAVLARLLLPQPAEPRRTANGHRGAS